MSFEENDESFLWRCDGCGLAAEFPSVDFYRSLSELKNRGWRIVPERDPEEGRAWTHYCSRCWRKRAAGNVADFLNRKAKAQ
jgi:hypothetical protein